MEAYEWNMRKEWLKKKRGMWGGEKDVDEKRMIGGNGGGMCRMCASEW